MLDVFTVVIREMDEEYLSMQREKTK